MPISEWLIGYGDPHFPWPATFRFIIFDDTLYQRE